MGTSPFCVNELFVSSRNTYMTRSHMALKIHLRKSNLDQRSISFLGPSVWNKLSNDLKILGTTTLFTQNYKKLVLKNLSNQIIVSIITSIYYYHYLLLLMSLLSLSSLKFLLLSLLPLLLLLKPETLLKVTLLHRCFPRF